MLTVVTPASSVDLVTDAELEDLLGTVPDNAGALIPVASVLAHTIAGRTLVEQEYRETLEPPTRWVLYLAGAPVTAVASVEVGGVALAATDYEVWTEQGALVREEGWGGGRRAGGLLTAEPAAAFQRQTVDVQYTAGYTTGPSGTLPSDIRWAVGQLVQGLAENPASAPLRELKVGDVTERYGAVQTVQDLSPSAASILLSYRRGW